MQVKTYRWGRLINPENQNGEIYDINKAIIVKIASIWTNAYFFGLAFGAHDEFYQLA